MAKDDAVLEILKSIQSTQRRHTATLDAVRSMLNIQGGYLSALQQEVRMIHAAINDMERTRFSSGEAQAIHDDLNRLQAEHIEFAARLAVLEETT